MAALILLISRIAASQPAAMWVDFVFAIFSFFMILYTSRVYENLISQKLLPTDATEVDLLCASVFNSQVMVSMGNPCTLHGSWLRCLHAGRPPTHTFRWTSDCSRRGFFHACLYTSLPDASEGETLGMGGRAQTHSKARGQGPASFPACNDWQTLKNCSARRVDFSVVV